MKRHIARQLEVTFEDEPFALVPLSALDGEMIAAKMAARERNQAAWELKQREFSTMPEKHGEPNK